MDDPAERLSVRSAGRGALQLSGEIDVYTAPHLERRIVETDDSEVLRIELSGVTFVDSSGLRVLISAHAAREEAGGRLELVAPSVPVMRLLELTALDQHLHIVEAGSGRSVG